MTTLKTLKHLKKYLNLKQNVEHCKLVMFKRAWWSVIVWLQLDNIYPSVKRITNHAKKTDLIFHSSLPNLCLNVPATTIPSDDGQNGLGKQKVHSVQCSSLR